MSLTVRLVPSASSWVIEMRGLRNVLDPETPIPPQDVTAEATLLDLSGDPVSGETWPVQMSLVAGSDDLFVAVVDATGLGVETGKQYRARINAQAGTLKRQWVITFRVVDDDD